MILACSRTSIAGGFDQIYNDLRFIPSAVSSTEFYPMIRIARPQTDKITASGISSFDANHPQGLAYCTPGLGRETLDQSFLPEVATRKLIGIRVFADYALGHVVR